MKNFFKSSLVKQDKNAKSLSYFCTKNLVLIKRDIIKQLVEESNRNGACDIRISLHKSPAKDFHNMIILQRKGNYYRPHKHENKVEAYQMIEGKMAIFIFDGSGNIINSHVLSPETNFIYRIGANKFHVTIPLTDFVIFHESKIGPFIREGDSIFADWTPDGSDPNEARKYFDLLLSKIKDNAGD